MSTEDYTMSWDGSTILNYRGQKILAVEIRKDKSLREIAEILGVDIRIVIRTAKEAIMLARLRGLHGPTSSTIDKLRKALTEMDK